MSELHNLPHSRYPRSHGLRLGMSSLRQIVIRVHMIFAESGDSISGLRSNAQFVEQLTNDEKWETLSSHLARL